MNLTSFTQSTTSATLLYWGSKKRIALAFVPENVTHVALTFVLIPPDNSKWEGFILKVNFSSPLSVAISCLKGSLSTLKKSPVDSKTPMFSLVGCAKFPLLQSFGMYAPKHQVYNSYKLQFIRNKINCPLPPHLSTFLLYPMPLSTSLWKIDPGLSQP